MGKRLITWFDVKKCKHVPVGPHVIPTSYTITDFNNVDHTLSITECEKDLGIWITSTLCPSVQCQKACVKAMQSLATIKCSFKYITTYVLSTTSRPEAHIMPRI